jgi:hypothetical protein
VAEALVPPPPAAPPDTPEPRSSVDDWHEIEQNGRRQIEAGAQQRDARRVKEATSK